MIDFISNFIKKGQIKKISESSNSEIINTARSKEIKRFINLWANNLFQIENIYISKEKEVRNKDFNFLKLIGNSIYYLNLFNSLIIVSVEKIEEKIIKETYQNKILLNDAANYIRFFNSLIASKIKTFFFRETPIINTNIPFIKIDLEIFKTANSILEYINKYDKLGKELKFNLSKFFYLSTLLYSFIYDKKRQKGAFLQFNYNKKIFEDFKCEIFNYIENINKEEDLRLYCSNFIANLAKYYLNKFGNLGLEDINNIKREELYSHIFDLLLYRQAFYTEPLTYHLADIIWKVDSMLQDDDEFFNKNEKIENDRYIIENIKSFIKKYFDISHEMYNKNKINYVALYDHECEFIKNIYKSILRQKDIKIVKEKSSNLSSIINKTKQSVLINFSFKTKKEYFHHLLEKINCRDEEDYKLINLIEKLDKNELLQLIILYSRIFRPEILKETKTEFVGFYKSGVFLGHLINIIYKIDKPVWLFKTRPYVATHPIHEDSEINFNSIIIFDESIKTGFTYSLYEAYLSRNIKKGNISTYFFSLFDFTYYEKIQSGIIKSYNSLIELNKKMIPTNYKELDYLFTYIQNKNISKLKFRIFDINKEIIKSFLDEIKFIDNKLSRFDLTFLLSNSKILFSICNSFKKLIIDKNRKKKNVFIFSPSSCGDILALVTAFLLKLENIEVTFRLPTLNNNVFNVGIDISIETGFTLIYKWSIFKNGFFKKEDKMNLENDFDLILTITQREKIFENIFSLYELK